MRKRRILVGVVLAALITAAVAYAAWTTSGTGPGKAKGGRLQALVVEQPTADPAGLLPGSTNGKLGLKVTNPASVPVTLTSVVPNGAITSSNGGCPASNVEFAPQTGLTIVLPAGSSQEIEVGGMSMQAGAPNECQDVTFTVPVRANAQTS